MTKVFSFPTHQDRQLVQFAITSYAQGKTDLSSMMRQVAYIMNQYNITKMHMDGYTVQVVEYLDTPIVIIEGQGDHEHCPGCHSDTDHARYLRTHQENMHKDFDVITVSCLECGAIYDTKGKNGRRAIW